MDAVQSGRSAHQAGSAGCRESQRCEAMKHIGSLTTFLPAWFSRRPWRRFGIAYAVASGLPGVYGLYATIVPLLAYALFGPSRILVLGPDSALAAVILGVTAPLATGDVNRAVALAGMMAIVSGAVCILAGVARPLRLPGKRPGSRRKRNGDYRQCSCDVAGKDRQVRIHREDGSIHKENRRGPKTREACANAESANASRSCAGALVINGPRLAPPLNRATPHNAVTELFCPPPVDVEGTSLRPLRNARGARAGV